MSETESSEDIFRLPGATHVAFDRSVRVIRCERCPVEEKLDESDSTGHILCFGQAHIRCPSPSTPASRKEASDKAYGCGMKRGFGLR